MLGMDLLVVKNNKILIDTDKLVTKLVDGALNVEQLYCDIETMVLNELTHESKDFEELCVCGSIAQLEDVLEETYEYVEQLTGQKVMFINNMTNEYTMFASANSAVLRSISQTIKAMCESGMSLKMIDIIMKSMSVQKVKAA